MSKRWMSLLGWGLAASLASPVFAANPSEPPRGDSVAGALGIAARASGTPLPAPSGARSQTLESAVSSFYERVAARPLSDQDRETTLSRLQYLSAPYREGLATILSAMTTAQDLRNAAFAGISRPEIAYAEDVALRAQFAPETVDAAAALGAASIIGRIDRPQMLRAAASLHAAVATAKHLFAVGPAPEERIDLPFDAITIGTNGGDVYTRDKQLIVEPGGDDLYVNNAGGMVNQQVFDATGGCVSGGGSTGKASPNLDCTPAPSRICTYDVLNNASGSDVFPVVNVPNHDVAGAGNGRDGSCGNDQRREAMTSDTANAANDGDSRDVSLLLDLGGSDRYTQPWSHDDPAFGLVDFCYPGETQKTNTNRDFVQGGTLAGIGMLWDDGAGDNVFRGRLNTQGSGHVGGIGMLFVTGGGDDEFWADRLAQGNGIAGGIGVLADDGGTNSFLLEPPVVYRNEFRPGGRECSQQGRAGQGEGGFLGAGVLWNGGRGTYRAVVHETEGTYPFAPVLDPSGDPLLAPGSDAQGSGESFPIPNTPGGIVAGTGILVDHSGNDTVCAGAGKIDGADDTTQSPGAIDIVCGTFNLPAEITIGDVAFALHHLGGGAVGVRVVMPS
ncbi:MAG: hypothetical protein ABR548_09415 [Actinomycetota bacterium]|nr:hypothetical protein [Actinomycetota bacterium]